MVLGLDAGVLTMAILIAVVAFILFINVYLIPEVGNWFLDAVVKMPRFDYTYQNGEQGNQNFQLYRQLRTIAFPIIIIALTLTAVYLMGEEFDVFRKGQAFSTLAKGIIIIIFIFTFPSFWDAYASGIEGLSKWILNPNNPNQANQKVSQLWQMVGSIQAPTVDWDTILQFLLNPNDAAQTIFRDVFLAVFKAFIAALLTFLMFVIGVVRIVLTGILADALPLLLALTLIPWFEGIVKRLIDVLIGLSLAPVFSALIVVAGLAVIQSESFAPLQQWLASIAVAFLAVSFPTIVAPLLGPVVGQLTTMMTGGLLAGTLLGAGAVIGAGTGAYRAVTSAIQAGVPLTPLGYAKTAMSGMMSGLRSGLEYGIVKTTQEALQTTFPSLARGMTPFVERAERKLARAGLDTVEGIVFNFAGSTTEGLLPSLAIQTQISDKELPNAIAEATKFNARIQELASKQKYAEIADIANEYLKLPKIPNKAVFGQMFAEQLNAYSKHPIALAKLHEGLKHIQQEGGLPAQPVDTLAGLIHFKDALRNLASSKYGIDIPNPEFEITDIKTPEQLPQGAMVIAGYPVKYTFANAIEYAKAKLAVADANEITKYKLVGTEIIGNNKRMQAIVTRQIRDILKSLGLDKNENKEFVTRLAKSITQNLTAYDPATVGAIYDTLKNKEVFADYLRTYIPSKEMHTKAEQLLPNVHIQQLWRETNIQNNTDHNTNSSTNKV
jgi:hypothetical protein